MTSASAHAAGNRPVLMTMPPQVATAQYHAGRGFARLFGRRSIGKNSPVATIAVISPLAPRPRLFPLAPDSVGRPVLTLCLPFLQSFRSLPNGSRRSDRCLWPLLRTRRDFQARVIKFGPPRDIELNLKYRGDAAQHPVVTDELD